MKHLMLLSIILIASGCANYKFGDITKKLVTLKANYCAEENVTERALALAAVHLIDPTWIPVCDLFTLEEITE